MQFTKATYYTVCLVLILQTHSVRAGELSDSSEVEFQQDPYISWENDYKATHVFLASFTWVKMFLSLKILMINFWCCTVNTASQQEAYHVEFPCSPCSCTGIILVLLTVQHMLGYMAVLNSLCIFVTMNGWLWLKCPKLSPIVHF